MRKCALYQLKRRFSEKAGTLGTRKVDTSLDFYKKLRIYKEKSNFGLINSRLVWMACERDMIVDNGEYLYNMSTKLIGTLSPSYLLHQSIIPFLLIN